MPAPLSQQLPVGSHHQFPRSDDPYDISSIIDPMRKRFEGVGDQEPAENEFRSRRQPPGVTDVRKTSAKTFNPRETIPYFQKDKSSEASAFGWLLKFTKHVRRYQ